MRLCHRIPALFLLAAFAVGGLVAPAVHRAEHGLAHRTRAEVAAAQADHVHTSTEVFTEPLSGIAGEHTPCVICLPRALSLEAPPAVPGPSLRVQPLGSNAPATLGAASLLHRAIRGPPVGSA